MKIQIVLDKDKLKSVSVTNDQGAVVIYTVDDTLLSMTLGDVINLYKNSA